ncbi:hypothetical protein SAMN05414139_09259 [Burkholderia sp. D7]|jgi:hypothetical protein|nr:hypothetical protein SAMN05414139_09259 [Burkholderia sp. D7]
MKYSGIDLHSNNAMIAVIDDQDYCGLRHDQFRFSEIKQHLPAL